MNYKEQIAMQNENLRLRKSLSEALEAMQEFVDRVERGEVRSKYTYNKYKAILAKTKEERDEKQKDEQRN